MLSAPVLLPRPRRIEAGTLTCGNSRRHPGEPRALTFHYIFHYISHPFSWWQLAPWLLRRGDALHSVHPILADTHTDRYTHTNTHLCADCHTHKLTLNTSLPALVNPGLPLPVYKSKGHEPGGRLWQLWHPFSSILRSPHGWWWNDASGR